MKIKQKTKVVSILAGKCVKSEGGVPRTDAPATPGTVLMMPGVVALAGGQRPNPRARAKSVSAYSEMKKTRGWDYDKLRKALEKRGIYAQSQFLTCLEVYVFLPSKAYKKKDGYRVVMRLRLAQNATYFSASLIVQVAWESVELHKPIRIPVVDTVKAQADEVIRAYHALYDGVYSVMGVQSLPGWPGPEGLNTMHQKVALAARQCVNMLNTRPELG